MRTLPPDVPPVVIDERYELGEVIGRGAMGDVHAAVDTRLDRPVAVKCLRAALAADPSVRSRFEDEARAAARLSHPGIVTVFDSGEWDGVPFLVMERLPGRTLCDEMQDGPLSQERVRAVGVRVAQALAAAHEVGVVHRDVKPGNVLLTADGDVKLSDFGIAKSTEGVDLTITGTVVGTPAYLAPERLAGRPASARSDLYSLGVVLYEALTGDKPYQGDTPVALAHAIHVSSPEPISSRRADVDADLAAAIEGAMARDPEGRPPSASHLAAALGRDPLVTEPTPAVDEPGTAVLPVVPSPDRVFVDAPPEGADHAGDLAPTAALQVHGDATTLHQPTAISPPAAEPVRAPAPGRLARWWRARTASDQRTLVVALVAALAIIGLALLTDRDLALEPPVTTEASTSDAPLPAPLEDALDRLEGAVTP